MDEQDDGQPQRRKVGRPKKSAVKKSKKKHDSDDDLEFGLNDRDKDDAPLDPKALERQQRLQRRKSLPAFNVINQ